MMTGDLEQVIQRVAEMEACFDQLLSAANEAPQTLETPQLQERLQKLTAYYESGLWLHDYQLDEDGLLLPELKRGVLSEDGVYDLLLQIQSHDGRML